MTTLQVVVDVATGWTSPDAPRTIDEPATADQPDAATWAKSLDPEARLGLHGRTLTQLTHGEPAVLLEEVGDWVKVAAPWQPSPEDPRGYPSWVRSAHVAAQAHETITPAPVASVAASPTGVLADARRFLGLAYLWGGTSQWGVDCSGLVHLAHRAAGVVVPRDAAAQHASAEPVMLGQERPGDLYFFAHDDLVYHVGFVAGDGWMLHATEDDAHGVAGGGCVEEAPLSPQRRASLAAAGRFL